MWIIQENKSELESIWKGVKLQQFMVINLYRVLLVYNNLSLESRLIEKCGNKNWQVHCTGQESLDGQSSHLLWITRYFYRYM